MTSDEQAGGQGFGSGPGPSGDRPEEGVKFTDKRRIDPETGQPRKPVEEPVVEEADAELDIEEKDEVEQAIEAILGADERVVELTADLQRVTAEYANYRKRVDRDREVNRELAVAAVLSELLPALDGIELARQNDDLNGPFKTVAENVEGVVAKFGLQRFGQAGDEFDPAIHEALTHAEREAEDEAAAQGPICTQIYQPGYRLGERVIRPARVAVVE